MEKEEHRSGSGGFRIGAVSEITGIPPETLRAWERRYGSIEPDRTASGFRVYSEADVERLILLKRLCQRGHAIGSIARLETDDLRCRLARCEEMRVLSRRSHGPLRDPGPLPVALADPELAARLQEAAAEDTGLKVVETADDLASLRKQLDGTAPVVVVASLSLMGDDPVEALGSLKEARSVAGVVIHYHFCTRGLIRELALAGASLVKGTVDLSGLRRAVRDASYTTWAPPAAEDDGAGRNGNGRLPGRRFSDRELGRLLEVESDVECECPSHLSTLVSSLAAFEEYCEECEVQNEEDARVHARLHRETAEARSLLERALEFLCRVDGIEL